jgi:glycosyltransferase involved in cell wall biosynthesis
MTQSTTEQTPLRIVHVVRSPVGGIFRHIADLASAQADAGHQVGVVCDSLTGGAFEAEKIAAILPKLALGSVRLPIAREIAPSDLRAMAKVKAALTPLEPQIIHAHGAKGGVFGRLVGAWMGRSRPIARFYAPHGGSLHYDSRSAEGRLYFAVERALERITDAMIHVSGYEAETYVAKVGRPRCEAFVVRNGLTAPEFELVEPAPDAVEFLFLGMLRDLKGVDVFIEALAKLAAGRAAPTAVIVGDGPDEARYRAMVAERGLADRVSFRPPTQTRDAFRLARAIVVPSRAESMPYVVLEAIAAGLPMVCTRVGGVPEIFGPFADELIPPGDADALAAAMAALAADPEAAKGAALARRAHVGDEFSLKEMSARIENIYRNAIETRLTRR